MQLFSLVGKIEGKIKLQKVIYILQEKGLLDFDLEYKYASYGPYSESLQIEMEYLSRIGFISEMQTDYGYVYELNEDFHIKIDSPNEIKQHVKTIFSILEKEQQILEVTSTIYYLKSSFYPERESIEKKIKLLKPKLQDKIGDAFEFYSSLESMPLT